jgi:hypothetical protein
MALYRDEVLRLTLPAIRAMMRPRDFRTRSVVEVEAGGVRATVRLVREPAATAFGGRRTWCACPRCGRKTVVLGVVQVAGRSDPVWACARRDCGAWRSRNRLKLLRRRLRRGEVRGARHSSNLPTSYDASAANQPR